jgi:excisionase family DNA binding protein
MFSNLVIENLENKDFETLFQKLEPYIEAFLSKKRNQKSIIADYFDYQSAAKYTGYKKDYIKLEHHRGNIQSIKIGKRVYFTKDNLDKWIESKIKK